MLTDFVRSCVFALNVISVHIPGVVNWMVDVSNKKSDKIWYLVPKSFDKTGRILHGVLRFKRGANKLKTTSSPCVTPRLLHKPHLNWSEHLKLISTFFASRFLNTNMRERLVWLGWGLRRTNTKRSYSTDDKIDRKKRMWRITASYLYFPIFLAFTYNNL